MISCVSAGDSEMQQVNNDSVDSANQYVEPVKNASFSKVSNTNYLKDSNFTVSLKDENNEVIVNKTVYFTIDDGLVINTTTDGKGSAKLLLNISKGTHTVKYIFNETGFTPFKSSTKVLVITTSNSKIKASAYKSYIGFKKHYSYAKHISFKNTYKITLTADGIPLSNRIVKFTINGKSYSKKTDSKGVASLPIGLKAGKYPIKFSYAGEKNIKKVSGSSIVYVIKGMPKKIIKANSLTYKNKVSAPFKIKLVNGRGNILKNKKVTFTLDGRTYTKYTDNNGIATIYLKLSWGTHSLKVSSAKTSYYKSVLKKYSIHIKSKAVNNGLWMFSSDMKKANLASLKKVGTKHIFLYAKAIDVWGRSDVEKFIKTASGYGIKVHLWMKVFNDDNDKWINPVKKGKINYGLIKSKINLAKEYAKVKGVAGIHFDYLRYPGNAYKYSNGVNAINYFTKAATSAIHAINSRFIVSAAVMPEPSDMKYYYGQDISTMGKCLDVIIPMIYKGNYNAGSSWIQKTTLKFVKKSGHAKIWSGIQTYHSDRSPIKLTSSALLKDADAAAAGGADGVILFRYGLTNLINFNKL
ncbi:Putative glycosyl hydrolase domain-containing protein [Methanobrevibacter gottschalkii]|uniref:Putative glycosyl hydrolase domain-containing protein n=1 Tax=Methanobrevibacter gottschalkii TaxID=190974 RepID=A0A1H7I157_9EURY|nr:putative glycoside hydrolase [Methanobrevibacter gottschalkii]SEK54225.1 Putative glycosyl hydrolase domain-containing protein [Methanobrevibacter gottschalkii]